MYYFYAPSGPRCRPFSECFWSNTLKSGLLERCSIESVIFYVGFTKVKVKFLCTHEGIRRSGHISSLILKLGAMCRCRVGVNILHIAASVILNHPISGNFCVEIHDFVFSCGQSPDWLFGIALAYGLDDPKNEGSIPGRSKRFFSSPKCRDRL